MIREKEILTLSDNKKYVVVSMTTIDTSDYAYLICQDDYSKVMICKVNEDSLEEVEDITLKDKLIIKFSNNLFQES